jgi:hypothetical protein
MGVILFLLSQSQLQTSSLALLFCEHHPDHNFLLRKHAGSIVHILASYEALIVKVIMYVEILYATKYAVVDNRKRMKTSPHTASPFNSERLQHLTLLIQASFIFFFFPIYIGSRFIRFPLHFRQPTHLLDPPLFIQSLLHKSPWIILIRLDDCITTC